MNRYNLHKAGINISEGMDRLKLDKATFERLLGTFVADESFAMMCNAIEEKDAPTAHLHAHSLKGVSANLSMTSLYALICPLVTILKAGHFEGLDQLMPPIKESYQQVIDTLKRESQST